jgi:hypothetical protein
MAALRAAILFLGFMSLYTWRQLYKTFLANPKEKRGALRLFSLLGLY